LAHGAACWICGGLGERQIPLKPWGLPDGRSVCRVCVRRLIVWVRASRDRGSVAGLASIWPVAHGAEQAGDDASSGLKDLLVTDVSDALKGGDDSLRASVALAYVELGLVLESVHTFATLDPSAIEAERLSERLLESLLWRLLDEAMIAPGARELLEAALYPPE